MPDEVSHHYAKALDHLEKALQEVRQTLSRPGAESMVTEQIQEVVQAIKHDADYEYGDYEGRVTESGMGYLIPEKREEEDA